jgi:hypothetical protein
MKCAELQNRDTRALTFFDSMILRNPELVLSYLSYWNRAARCRTGAGEQSMERGKRGRKLFEAARAQPKTRVENRESFFYLNRS